MKPSILKENIFIIALILLVLSVCFYDILFFGKTFKITPNVAQSLPTGPYQQENNKLRFFPVNGSDSPLLEETVYQFIKVNLKRGILPLWNPHQACGYPLIGLIQVGMFFPLNLILYIFPSTFNWDILIFSRFFLAGLFSYWCMRYWKFEKIPSFTAALCFMLSGPMVVLQYWTANVNILLPLLLLTLEKLIRKTTPRSVSLAGICIAFTIFGGHPEHIFLVNFFGCAYFIFRLFSFSTWTERKKAFSYLIFSYLLAAGLTAFILFPFFRNMLTELWHAHPPMVGLTTGEVKNRFLSIALPHFFQREPLTFDYTFSGWWGGYIGTIPLALAFLSLFNQKRKKANYFFAVSALIIILKTYGVPIINWIGYLPIFHTTRFYVHAAYIFAFTIAVLAGMGMEIVLTNKDSLKKSTLFAFFLILLILIHLFIFRAADHIHISIRAALFCAGLLAAFLLILFMHKQKIFKKKTAGIVLIGLLIFELFCYIPRERSTRFDSFGPVPYIEYLHQKPRERVYGIFGALYPNSASGFQLDDFGVFFGLVPKRYVNFINTLMIENLFRNDLRPPAMRTIPVTFFNQYKPYCDLLNIRYTIAPKNLVRTLPAVGIKGFPKPIYTGEVHIYENKAALPRAFIVHRAAFEPDSVTILKKMKTMTSLFRYITIIQHPPIASISKKLQNVPAFDRSFATITNYTPNEVIINAKMENPGFLILSDTYHPDWKVYVNGKESKIYAADYLLRAVFLEKGEHALRFVFAPLSFYGGLLISALCLLISLLLWFEQNPFAKKARQRQGPFKTFL